MCRRFAHQHMHWKLEFTLQTLSEILAAHCRCYSACMRAPTLCKQFMECTWPRSVFNKPLAACIDNSALPCICSTVPSCSDFVTLLNHAAITVKDAPGEEYDSKVANLKKELGYWESYLGSNEYMAGSQFSLAGDARACCGCLTLAPHSRRSDIT